jgi:hypothetical protein
MSSFLDNLAARVLHPAAALRPRLAGLFEPPDGNSSSSAPLPADIAQTVVAPAPRNLMQDARPVARQPAPIERQVIAQRTAAAPPVPPMASPPLPAHSQIEPWPTYTSLAQERQPSAAPRHTTPADVEVSLARPDREVARPSSQPAMQQTNWHAAAPAVPSQPSERSPEPAIVPARRAPVEPIGAPAQPRPAAEPPAARVDATAPPAPAPTIHVTIGRVEVRANLPAASQPAAPRRGSAISLDDYLQQQAERRR